MKKQQDNSYMATEEVASGRKGRKQLKKARRYFEAIIEKAVAATAFVSFAVIILICVFIFRESLPLFTGGGPDAVKEQSVGAMETYGGEHLDPDADGRLPVETKFEAVERKQGLTDLAGPVWQPVSLNPRYGLLPLIIGSLKVTLIAILFAAPIAILAALYTAVFAPRWAKEITKPAIEILAGFPSVVIGFFALIVLASFMQNIFGFQYRLNAFVGGIALSLAVIPIIYTISEDAITSVPRSFVEAALALGARKWESALFVVLPAATPGIFASVLLGIGRAFGETMIVLMATGNAALLTFDFFSPARTMSATIGAEMAEVVFGDTHYTVLFLIGVLLFAFSFSLNFAVEMFVRRKLMKRFTGAAG
jgi:phosphate transport system permease protein